MKKTFFAPRPRPSGPRPSRLPEVKKDNRKHRINDEIVAPEVRVVDQEGKLLGVMAIEAALQIAEQAEQDLVLIAPQATPPVAKVINYGKFAYELQKREKIQKKSQHQQTLKEIRFKAHTDTHDFDFKTRHAREFLIEGHKVKASVMFRGREITRQEYGIELLKRFVAALEDVSKIDQDIKSEGRTVAVLLAPEKKKKKSEKEDGDDTPTGTSSAPLE